MHRISKGPLSEGKVKADIPDPRILRQREWTYDPTNVRAKMNFPDLSTAMAVVYRRA